MNAIEADDSVRCVILPVRGSFLRRRRYQDVQGHDHLVGRKAVSSLPHLSQPGPRWSADDDAHAKAGLAQVQGAAAGIGLSFALAADLAIAADDANSRWRITNSVFRRMDRRRSSCRARWGCGKAKELAFLGDRFDAQAALDFGVVNRVVPRSDLEATVDEWAGRLTAMGRPRPSGAPSC